MQRTLACPEWQRSQTADTGNPYVDVCLIEVPTKHCISTTKVQRKSFTNAHAIGGSIKTPASVYFKRATQLVLNIFWWLHNFVTLKTLSDKESFHVLSAVNCTMMTSDQGQCMLLDFWSMRLPYYVGIPGNLGTAPVMSLVNLSLCYVWKEDLHIAALTVRHRMTGLPRSPNV